MFLAAPIPSWLQDLITNSRCQFGDRHKDEKPRRGSQPHTHCAVDVITATVAAKGGRCWALKEEYVKEGKTTVGDPEWGCEVLIRDQLHR